MLEFIENNKKVFDRILWVFVILASIKSIVTDTGFDNSYTVAMSYRHLNGDMMFKYMWEPHQTSIFFTDILMFIYHIFVPSYTGVMIYLQVMGTLFLALVGYVLYKNLKSYIGDELALLAGLFFFIFRAKQTPFPDFANLQICFSALAFVFIVKLIKDEQKWWYLLIASVCLCLEVLSYPSTVITAIPLLVGLIVCTRKKLRNVLLLAGTCAGIGIIYVGYFIIRLGLDQFVGNIQNIFYSDSHSGERIEISEYLRGMIVATVWVIVAIAVSFAIIKLIEKIKKNRIEFLPVLGIVLFVSEFVMLLIQKKTGLDWTCCFYILPLFLIIAGAVCGFKKMNGEEKAVWIIGLIFSASSFAATALLTDLGIITVAAYLVLGAVVSFIPLKYCGKQIYTFALVMCALVTLHRGLVVWGYANKGHIWMINDIEAIVTKGPNIGIACDYMRYYQTNADIEDHGKFIGPDDSVLLVDTFVIDSVEFMLINSSISNFSTIDTPIYNERLVTYYEQYPEKEPSVVAVSCWYGGLMVPADSWIMKWVENNYEAVGDGKYWRYYRKKM